MDKHQNYNTQGTTLEKHSKGLNQKNKVDINVLNRVRTDKKREIRKPFIFWVYFTSCNCHRHYCIFIKILSYIK